MTIEQVLDRLERDEQFMQSVRHWQVLPAKEAEFADFPAKINPKVLQALNERGIKRLYSHQAEAIEHTLQHQNTVIVTPTASGKTLCYNLPVLNKIVENADTRALYLFPTKALSQDQITELHSLIEKLAPQINFGIKSYTFDGDTPVTVRKTIKSSGHIVVTNPDMLHTGILPHHTQWIKLFENLQYIIIDEIHHYRGAFGSHLANVIRRLKRICRFYNSRPTFICCSATIANPLELAEQLTGEKMTLVDKNGAPHGEKHFILYNPPMVNRELGIRRSYLKESERVASYFIHNMLQTVIFARSRMNVEILLTYIKEAFQRQKKSPSLIRGYRGGYLPNERREIEKGLRDGSIIGVVSTNALELGIDIGQLQVAVLAGYPGTISSSLQQMGRAGRRSDTSAAIMVSSSSPLDQYMAENPAYFLTRSPESGIIDPDNLVILLSHIKCAAFELPFDDDERYGSNFSGGLGLESTQEILEFLQDEGIVHRSEDRWFWTAETYPAESISLRSAAEENVVIIDTTLPKEKVIGEIDLFAAQLMVHDEAIYLHGALQYHVDKLDWDRRKAYVHQVHSDHYTDAQLKSDIKVLDIFEEKAKELDHLGYGEVSVTSVATMYKKIKFNTHENLGWGKIHLPELELHTMAFWYSFPSNLAELLATSQSEAGDALKGAANLLANIIPIFIMGDRRDFSALPMARSPFTEQPTIYFWEHYPGGMGYSKKLYSIFNDIVQAAFEVINNCPCLSGCPSCSGPILEIGEKGKEATLKLLEYLQRN
ncbi:MAG: DEAD/DEAH box helicase [Calditrichaeota bacterium]|nr:MAG: DEAD/DEAH box helicase [Calditrichota bacterium]